MRLKDKVAIVTGAGQGIGEEVVRTFAREGSKIVIAEINEETGLSVLDELTSAGIEAIFVKSDVTDEENMKELIRITVEKFGGIDILVNNAGTTIRKSVQDTSLEEWQKVININLTGPFLCSKYVWPEMIKRGGGSIINIGSWHAVRTYTRNASYSASKGGVHSLTMQMSLDGGPHNIRVNAVCPSIVDTPLYRSTYASLPDPEEAFRLSLDYQPMGRIAKVEDIANACLFFASDESAYVSGQILMVDGAAINKQARPLMFD